MKPHNLYLSPAALKEIDQVPGHVRQRVRRAILALRTDPFPPTSKRLTVELTRSRESWRFRIDRWRIVYVMDPANQQILVIAVRQRPPYQYEDLGTLLSELDSLD